MSYQVTLHIRDGKIKTFKCDERPSSDSFWTYIYHRPGHYTMERSEAIEKIEVKPIKK